jgi:hypothetical protein
MMLAGNAARRFLIYQKFFRISSFRAAPVITTQRTYVTLADGSRTRAKAYEPAEAILV